MNILIQYRLNLTNPAGYTTNKPQSAHLIYPDLVQYRSNRILPWYAPIASHARSNKNCMGDGDSHTAWSDLAWLVESSTTRRLSKSLANAPYSVYVRVQEAQHGQ